MTIDHEAFQRQVLAWVRAHSPQAAAMVAAERPLAFALDGFLVHAASEDMVTVRLENRPPWIHIIELVTPSGKIEHEMQVPEPVIAQASRSAAR